MRAAVGFVCLAACYSPSPGVGIPCSAQLTCPGDQVCDTSQVPPTCGPSSSATADAAADSVVGCTATCDGMTPVCDAATHACRGCIADAECNGVCTEYSGECVGDGQAIFISPTGDDAGNCTRGKPCKTFGKVLAQIAGNRRVVVVEDGSYTSAGNVLLAIGATGGRIVISGIDATADGAFLTATTSGTATPQIVNTANGTDVVIEGVTIHDGAQDAIRSFGTSLILYRVDVTNNGGIGVRASGNDTSSLHVWSSRITGNAGDGVNSTKGSCEILRTIVANNANGGVTTQGPTTIVGSILAHNGTTSSSYGGIRLQSSTTATIAFDTIAYNVTNGLQYAGIQANNAVSLDSCIVAENNNASTGVPQTSPAVTASYSLFTTMPPPFGTGNVMGTPMFVDTQTDFHLRPGSPAQDAGNPAATVTTDIDGDHRPSGGGYEIGADELP